jgi:hypothetical protein
LDPSNPSVVGKLRQAGIGWLVFKNPRRQDWIEASGVGEPQAAFGQWRIHRVKADTR